LSASAERDAMELGVIEELDGMVPGVKVLNASAAPVVKVPDATEPLRVARVPNAEPKRAEPVRDMWCRQRTPSPGACQPRRRAPNGEWIEKCCDRGTSWLSSHDNARFAAYSVENFYVREV